MRKTEWGERWCNNREIMNSQMERREYIGKECERRIRKAEKHSEK